MSKQGMTLLQFEDDFAEFEQNRMYPPGYRKEAAMTKRQKVAKKLNEIAGECEGIAVDLPENNVGLPTGTFLLDSFLKYIACAITGDIKPY